MKKLLTLISVLVSLSCFSQNIKYNSAGRLVSNTTNPAFIDSVNGVRGLIDSLANKADSSIIVSSYASAVTLATGGKRKTIYVLDDANYYLNGIYKWDGSMLQKQADEPFLQNSGQLKDLHKQLEAFAASPSNSYLAWANYGDSVSPDILEALFRKFDKNIPRGALMFPAAMQASLVVTKTGTISYDGTVINNPTSGVYAGDGTANVSDFTYLGSSNHVTLENGATITLSGGQSTEFTQIRVNLAKAPGMGTATIELFALGTTTPVLQTATVNLSNASLGVSETDFTVSKTGKYDVRISASGRVVHLVTAFLNQNGYIPCEWNSRGGSDLDQNNYANSTIRNYLANEFNISLWILMAKENYSVVNPQSSFDVFNSVSTPHSVLACSSFPDVSALPLQKLNNSILKQVAIKNGAAWWDNFRIAGDYATIVGLGWQGDGTHVSGDLKDFSASLLYSQIGMDNIKPFLRSQINHDRTANYVVTNKYALLKGDNSGDEIVFAEPAGGGAPTLANISNIQKLFWGDKASASYMGGYGSESASYLNNGSFAPIRASSFTGTDATSTSGIAGHLGVSGNMYFANNTIAALPAANQPFGAMRYATDGRKLIEIVTGTGVVAYCSGGVWRRVSDDTPLSEIGEITRGTGSPQGIVAGPAGKIYIRTDGGSGTTVYVRQTGSTTNWDSLSLGSVPKFTVTSGANVDDIGILSTSLNGVTIQSINNTNTLSQLNIMGKGTGVTFNGKNIASTFLLGATDEVADATNFSNLTFEAWQGNGFGLFSVKGGTGSQLPLTLDMTGAARTSMNQLYLGTNGSIGINNASPSSVAQLDIASTTKGILPPRMTRTQFNAITPTAGLLAFGTTLNKPVWSDGTTTRVALDSATADSRYIINHTGTPTVALGSNITGSVAVTGTDTKGTVTVTVTGISSLATLNELFTLTFSSAYASTPTVVFSNSSAQAATLEIGATGLYKKNAGTTSFQIATSGSYTTPASATYSFDYIVQ